MSTKLNTVTLADPVRCSERHVRAGDMVTMANGARRVRTTTTNGYYRAWTVVWQGITAAELAQISQAADLAMLTPKAFSPPDTASTINVLTEDALSIDDVAWMDGAWHYDVTLSLIESDPT